MKKVKISYFVQIPHTRSLTPPCPQRHKPRASMYGLAFGTFPGHSVSNSQLPKIAA